MTARRVLAGPGSCSLIASLGVIAGVAHLAMVPSHWGEWLLEGAAFAAVGWAQLGLAVLCWRRPTRNVLVATSFVHLAAVGAWAVTRTSGSPWGPHAWHAESITFVDATVVAVELVTFAVCAHVLLARPRPVRSFTVRFAAVPPVAAALLATAVLASPSARDHAHQTHGGHGHEVEDARTDLHDHPDENQGPVGGEHAAHDDHQPLVVDDRGLTLLQNGHQHGSGEVELDLQTQLRLHAQLAVTLDVAALYPTVADAEAAGFRRAGPFAPGLGTHYLPPFAHMDRDGVLDPEDLWWPTLIFDGWEPSSPIAGFMYQLSTPDGDEPEGFAGPNDHWHYHTDVCIVIGPDGIDAPLGADRSATQAQCDAFGGLLIPRTGYMVHVWTVPGYESPLGIFSEVNPALTCPDGTYYMKPDTEIGLSLTACRGTV